MGQRAEHQIDVPERSLVGTDELERTLPRTERFPPLCVGARESEIHVWMSPGKQAQLATGVATGAKNTDRNFMHQECITLR
jgi:hypothetical protein